MSKTLINDARVMSKGQVTIPKNIRAALGVTAGDRVTFVAEGGTVRVVNSAVYAMQKLQEQMAQEARQAGFDTEEDVAEWITAARREENEGSKFVVQNTMSYKGYTGSVEISETDGVFFGKVRGTHALISYEGNTAEELLNDFHRAVDDYLALCETTNTQPEKPLSFATFPLYKSEEKVYDSYS